jgi:hypothetical protein
MYYPEADRQGGIFQPGFTLDRNPDLQHRSKYLARQSGQMDEPMRLALAFHEGLAT